MRFSRKELTIKDLPNNGSRYEKSRKLRYTLFIDKKATLTTIQLSKLVGF